jgi:hypothetical protein
MARLLPQCDPAYYMQPCYAIASTHDSAAASCRYLMVRAAAAAAAAAAAGGHLAESAARRLLLAQLRASMHPSKLLLVLAASATNIRR